MNLTKAEVGRLVAQLKAHAIPPAVVKTKKEARQLTRDDPARHQWKVGEEYYMLVSKESSIPVSPTIGAQTT